MARGSDFLQSASSKPIECQILALNTGKWHSNPTIGHQGGSRSAVTADANRFGSTAECELIEFLDGIYARCQIRPLDSYVWRIRSGTSQGERIMNSHLSKRSQLMAQCSSCLRNIAYCHPSVALLPTSAIPLLTMGRCVHVMNEIEEVLGVPARGRRARSGPTAARSAPPRSSRAQKKDFENGVFAHAGFGP